MGLKIVVADDWPDTASAMAALLRRDEHTVRECANGQEALQCIEEMRPDVAILDIGMPVMDGLAAARVVKASSWGRRTLLVGISAWGSPEDHRRAKEAGFDHYLVKPPDLIRLRAILTAIEAASG